MARQEFDWRLYRGAAIAFFAIKAALLVLAHPFMDETYYWLWGQHPALSYFDHPPLIGWTQGIASLLGWNLVGLRIFVALTLVGDVLMLRHLARHVAGSDWERAFWMSTMLLASTPIFFGVTNLALPDHLLLFFSLLAILAFARFSSGFVAGVPRWRFLYLTALAIGFALLSKYTGALLLGGMGASILLFRPLRPLLRSFHAYAAVLLVGLMQTPVLIWNLQNDYASFGFVTGGRKLLPAFDLGGVGGYLSGFLLVLSPFLIWPTLRFAFARDEQSVTSRTVFWLSSLSFFFASVFTNILIHWNVIAYAAALPFLFRQLRSRFLIVGHLTFGLIIAGILAINTTVIPVLAIVGSADQTSAWNFGWNEIAAEVRAIAQKEGTDFVAATDYALASPLAFALQDPDVVSLSPRVEAFDFWFDPEVRRGQTAIIVADRWRRLPNQLRAQFGEVIEAKKVTIERLDRVVDRYSIYIARAYAPSIQ